MLHKLTALVAVALYYFGVNIFLHFLQLDSTFYCGGNLHVIALEYYGKQLHCMSQILQKEQELK